MEESRSEAMSDTNNSNTSALDIDESDKRQDRATLGNTEGVMEEYASEEFDMIAAENLQEDAGVETLDKIEDPKLNLTVVKSPDTSELRGILPDGFYDHYYRRYAHLEVEWPDLFWRKFECFPMLPLELRRKIWLHALPGPRLVKLEHTSTDKSWSQKLGVTVITEVFSLGVEPFHQLVPVHFLWTCRESHEVLMKNYRRLRIDTPADGEYQKPEPYLETCYIRASIVGYIDPKLDTLIVEDVESLVEKLSNIQCRFNFSEITSLAITQFADQRMIIPATLPKVLKTHFPTLKHLSMIANHVDNGPSIYNDPNILMYFRDVNLRHAIQSYYYVRPVVDNIVRNADMFKTQFLEQAKADPDGGIDHWISVDLAVSFMGRWNPDCDALIFKQKYRVDGKNAFTLAPRNSGKITLLLGSTYRIIETDSDGIADVTYQGIKELFEGHGNKYLRWPWNYESDVIVHKDEIDNDTQGEAPQDISGDDVWMQLW